MWHRRGPVATYDLAGGDPHPLARSRSSGSPASPRRCGRPRCAWSRIRTRRRSSSGATRRASSRTWGSGPSPAAGRRGGRRVCRRGRLGDAARLEVSGARRRASPRRRRTRLTSALAAARRGPRPALMRTSGVVAARRRLRGRPLGRHARPDRDEAPEQRTADVRQFPIFVNSCAHLRQRRRDGGRVGARRRAASEPSRSRARRTCDLDARIRGLSADSAAPWTR